MNKKERSNFTGTLGFVMAAAGSAVGLGNIWRFPYLAAKDNGGVFILVYIILALTFGIHTAHNRYCNRKKDSAGTAHSLWSYT